MRLLLHLLLATTVALAPAAAGNACMCAATAVPAAAPCCCTGESVCACTGCCDTERDTQDPGERASCACNHIPPQALVDSGDETSQPCVALRMDAPTAAALLSIDTAATASAEASGVVPPAHFRPLLI